LRAPAGAASALGGIVTKTDVLEEQQGPEISAMHPGKVTGHRGSHDPRNFDGALTMSEVMTRSPVTIAQDTSIREAA
jgi:CBS domain-containing protein